MAGSGARHVSQSTRTAGDDRQRGPEGKPDRLQRSASAHLTFSQAKALKVNTGLMNLKSQSVVLKIMQTGMTLAVRWVIVFRLQLYPHRLCAGHRQHQVGGPQARRQDQVGGSQARRNAAQAGGTLSE